MTTSAQRYLSGLNNDVLNATLVASSVRASTAIERTAVARAGGGHVRLGGAYTGHEAAEIDVEIVAAGGIPRASVPTFIGVGNGDMTIDSVDAAAPLQSLTFTLTDLGILTTTAGLTVREVVIQAKTPGTPGNAIRITVTPALALTGTPYSLLTDWSAGTATQTGEQWDFGALPLSPSGELDANSPRIVFGNDPQVYRPYREYKDGAWRYGLSPALVRTVEAGTRVYAVAGSYTVTVTDGVDTETHTDIVTFFDFLTSLAFSDLVEVAGVVAADRRPGGQAAVDVPLRTSAWLQLLSGIRLEQVTLPADAPTQSIIVRCINADVVGRERWSVSGTVSGELDTAVTGQLYTSAAASFLVPVITPATTRSGEWSFKYQPVTRGDGQGLPSVCIRPFRFGRNAKPRTVTFRYQKRPPPDCKCSDMPTPRLSLACLGLEDQGESNMEADFQNRLVPLVQYLEEYTSSNIDIGPDFTSAQTTDLDFADRAVQIFIETLEQIYTVDVARTYWDGCADKLKDDLGIYYGRRMGNYSGAWSSFQGGKPKSIIKNPNNDHVYRLVSATIDGAEWDGIVPQIRLIEPDDAKWVTDGSEFELEFTMLGEPVTPTPQADQGGVVGSYIHNPTNLHYYKLTGITRDGETQDEGPILGGTTGSYPLAWSDPAWTVDGSAFSFTRTISGIEYVYTYTDVGTELPTDTPTDKVIVMTYKDLGAFPKGGADMDSVSATLIDQLMRRYQGMMNTCLVKAGLLPKFNASSDAGACWRDYPDETHWWADVDGYYLPAFTNKGYTSARRDTETGRPYSTFEFGFGLVVACPDRLLEGDQITIRIEQVDGDRPYQVGDEAVLETIAAGPAWLVGGVDGTDELTWRVVGSVSGTLPDYVVPLAGTVPPYVEAGVSLSIAPGGIPFALGDRFDFAVEAGQFRWRQDGGAWSADADIPADGLAMLPDGLTAQFVAGAAPSFVPGDRYAFAVHQPFAVSHVRQAHADAWGWDSAAATLDIDLGSVRPLAFIAIARYDLPDAAAVSVQWSADNVTWSAPLAMPLENAVSVVPADAAARYLRLSVTDAAGGSIGWLWAGTPLATENSASTCARNRNYAMTRNNSIFNPRGLFNGLGNGWEVAWDDCLTNDDAIALVALADFAQRNDEPILFVPQHLNLQEAALVGLRPDSLLISDFHQYQPNRPDDRLLSASVTLDAVLA